MADAKHTAKLAVLREARKLLRKTLRLHQRGVDEAMDVLVDTLDGAEVGSDRIRRVLVALGCRRSDLPKDIPPAGEKRGRRG